MPPRRKADAAAGPAKRGGKKAAAAAAAPVQADAMPPVLTADLIITRPFACPECQRIRVAQLGGWLPWSCHDCKLPVWFQTRAERNEYAKQSPAYCRTCRSAPCNCASRGGGADNDALADEGPFVPDDHEDWIP